MMKRRIAVFLPALVLEVSCLAAAAARDQCESSSHSEYSQARRNEGCPEHGTHCRRLPSHRSNGVHHLQNVSGLRRGYPQGYSRVILMSILSDTKGMTSNVAQLEMKLKRRIVPLMMVKNQNEKQLNS